MAIGWIPDIDYEQLSVQLQPGDRLYLYSDGIPEAMDANLNVFGDQRMLEVLELGQVQSIQDSTQLLLNSVQRWCRQNGPKDDASILGMEILPG